MYQGELEAPDLTAGSVPSSLLLTRQARPHDPPSGEAKENDGEAPGSGDLLVAGDLQLTPESTRVVRAGHVVYCLYDLYNPTAEDLAVACH